MCLTIQALGKFRQDFKLKASIVSKTRNCFRSSFIFPHSLQYHWTHFSRDPTSTLKPTVFQRLPAQPSIFSLTDALSNEGTTSMTNDCHILSSPHDSTTPKFRKDILCYGALPGVTVLLGPDDGSWNIGGIGHIALTPCPGLLRNITAIIVQVCQKRRTTETGGSKGETRMQTTERAKGSGTGCRWKRLETHRGNAATGKRVLLHPSVTLPLCGAVWGSFL